jgi:ABC-type multidrug transport system permease subunit
MRGVDAMAWKEWRSLATARNRTQLVLPLAALAFLPIWAPLEMGSAWLRDPILPTVFVIATSLLVVGLIVPDAIAGERERRTLATLLAGPLSDGAILSGKLLVPVLVNEVVIVVMLAVSVLVANIAHWTGGVELFPIAMIIGMCALGLVLGLFTAALGVLVSLRAATVQSAQQVLVAALMTPFLVGGVAFTLAATGGGPPPDWLVRGDVVIVILVACTVLAVVDAVLLWIVRLRFHRSRLIVLG